MPGVRRMTADLTQYPDLVVIYLGLRVQSIRGLATLARLGPQIEKSVAAKPDGLLLHEPFFFSLFPPHLCMRQYWRDFDSLEHWARSLPHKQWWGDFVRAPQGVGFWHETYFRKGGFEAVYDELNSPIGLLAFASNVKAEGAMFSARQRAAK